MRPERALQRRVGGAPGVRLCAVLLCALSSCDPVASPVPEVAPRAAAIRGGAPTATIDSGSMLLTTPTRACSATPITRRWAVTAAECLCDLDLLEPSRVWVHSGTMGSPIQSIVIDDTLNLAFLRSLVLMPLEREVLLWEGSSSELVGREVECFGHAAGDDRAERDAGVEDGDAGAEEPAEISPIAHGARFTVTAAGSSLGTSAPACGAPRAVDGFVTAGRTDDADAGGPCFVDEAGQRQLVGIRGGLAPGAGQQPPETLWVDAEAIRTRLRAATDVFSAAECALDVPGSEHGLVPHMAAGAPDVFQLNLVAIDPYGREDGGAVRLWHTHDGRLRSWNAVDTGALAPARAVRAAPLFRPGQSSDLPLVLSLSGMDDDVSTVSWLGPMGFGGPLTIPDGPIPGGLAAAQGAHAYLPADGTATIPLYDSPFGPGWVFDRLPFPQAAPDVYHAPSAASVLLDLDLNVWVAYRGLDERMLIYHASLGCLGVHQTTTWCNEAGAYDFVVGREHFALGLKTGEGNYTVTGDHDGSMTLWFFDGNGVPQRLGGVAGPTLSRPSLAEFLGELYVAYTTEDWLVRVKPAGNCLGNSPPDF